MKKRLRTEYVCQSCGNVSPKWLGKCSECNEWNSFVEEITDKINDVPLIQDDVKSVITSLGDIETDTSERIKTEISELNTVLGGGLVPLYWAATRALANPHSRYKSSATLKILMIRFYTFPGKNQASRSN